MQITLLDSLAMNLGYGFLAAGAIVVGVAFFTVAFPKRRRPPRDEG